MSKHLEEWLDEIVSVITTDGRQFIGVLVGYDLSTNVILQFCHERIYSQTTGVQKVQRQTMVLRGDTVICVGKINEDKDIALDFDAIRGEQLPPLNF